MNNYVMYKDQDSSNYIVEIFNECDLHLVQKELVNKGFIIRSIMNVLNTNSIYMLVHKMDEE